MSGKVPYHSVHRNPVVRPVAVPILTELPVMLLPFIFKKSFGRNQQIIRHDLPQRSPVYYTTAAPMNISLYAFKE
jgi:hypothetical protein